MPILDSLVSEEHILDGAVTYKKISVSQLSAIAADLGTITAGLITGATIRTAADGSRIVMNTDELIAYDDADNEIFKVILTGDDVGDVIIGDFAGDKGVKWDKSAGTFTIRGRIYGTDLIVDDGKRNTILSATAFGSNETGYDNVAIGIYTLGDNTDGDDNIGIGQLALRYNTTGDNNIALGHNVLTYNTVGSNNIALGLYSLYWNTSGYRNIALGFGCLNKNRTGYHNTGVGVYALYNNTTGYHNVAIGYDALYFLEPDSKAITHFYDYDGTVAGTVRAYSSFHGLSTDDSVEITGTENYDGTYTITVIDASNFYFTAAWVEDEETGWWQIEGEAAENTAVGYYSGWMLDKGARNTLLGFKSGYFLQAGSGNVCIGYEAGAAETGSNKLYINNSDSANPLIYGEFDNNLVKIFNYLYLPNIRSGATQVAAGAAAGELWKTSSHATLPDNVVMIGA